MLTLSHKQPLGGATKCFEAPFVNDLWMTDFSPGPYLHPADVGKAVPTFLCVIIDDHSLSIRQARSCNHVKDSMGWSGWGESANLTTPCYLSEE